MIRLGVIDYGRADTGLHLSRALDISEGFWLGLQADFDLEARKAKIQLLGSAYEIKKTWVLGIRVMYFA